MKGEKIVDMWFIIANPVAGRGKVKRKWPGIKHKLEQSNIPYKIVFTNKKWDGVNLVMIAIEEGYRKIIGIGGDGTNNEIINGILLQQVVPSTDILYTLLSMGTGNDWVKTHGIPRNPKKWISYLKSGNKSFQNIGWVSFYKNGEKESRFFANVAGMAYDAFLVKKLNERKALFSSKLTYLLYLLYCLFQYKLCEAKVHFNGKSIASRFYSINIGICKYSGGGMQAVPHADPRGSYFALSLFKELSKWKVLLNTHRLYTGSIFKIKEVNGYESKRILVEGSKASEIGLEVDGEYVGETPVEFQLREKALSVLLP